MKTLIFDSAVSGHHLEYLHHVHERAAALPEREFVFAVPEEFKKVAPTMHWTDAANIHFHFIDARLAGTPRAQAKMLGQLVREHGADEVLLIMLMSFLPWLPFYVPARVRVNGIVYLIYLYRWETASLTTRIADVLKYLIFTKFRVFHRVFLLNDRSAPAYLNRKFGTEKFAYLPDPFAGDSGKGEEDAGTLREKFGLKPGEKIFLHFGSMAGRKGTLTILQALLTGTVRPDIGTFLFVGRVGKDIRERFFALAEQARERGFSVVVREGFFTEGTLIALSRASEVILVPYTNTEQSSGVIAHAANVGRPVISPGTGLLGKLVRKYRLGVCLEKLTPETLAEALNSFAWRELKIRSEAYLESRSVEAFSKILLPKN